MTDLEELKKEFDQMSLAENEEKHKQMIKDIKKGTFKAKDYAQCDLVLAKVYVYKELSYKKTKVSKKKLEDMYSDIESLI